MPVRFVYWMNVSMDLHIEERDNEAGQGDWLRIDAELHEEFNRRAAGLTAMVQGRVVYETMEDFWPAAASDTSLPAHLREYGRIWRDIPKYLVSHTRESADFNTQVIRGPDAVDRLAELREQSHGAIGIGGATLATQVLRAGLLDELLLFVHPTILGAGRPLFDGDPRVDCELIEIQEFAGGVTLQRFRVR